MDILLGLAPIHLEHRSRIHLAAAYNAPQLIAELSIPFSDSWLGQQPNQITNFTNCF